MRGGGATRVRQPSCPQTAGAATPVLAARWSGTSLLLEGSWSEGYSQDRGLSYRSLPPTWLAPTFLADPHQAFTFMGVD